MTKCIRTGACLLLAVFLSMAAWGCRDKEADIEHAKYTIYHINAEGTGLKESVYTGQMEQTETAVKDMLKALKKPDKDIEEQPAIPKKVKVTGRELDGEKLRVDFNAEYADMGKVQEVLTRAAVVRSLTQIPGVDMVAITVDGIPLTDKEGIEYGYMQAEDFVQNTGSSINFFEVAELTLYFANETGDKLVKENVSVRYNSNMAKERLIVEQLMKGPSQEGHQRTIPASAKLLGISVKDGVCYINLDEGMDRTIPGVKPEVMIYSLINSVIDSGNTGRVQISIDGDSSINFQESVELSKPLTANLDLVEEEKKN